MLELGSRNTTILAAAHLVLTPTDPYSRKVDLGLHSMATPTIENRSSQQPAEPQLQRLHFLVSGLCSRFRLGTLAFVQVRNCSVPLSFAAL